MLKYLASLVLGLMLMGTVEADVPTSISDAPQSIEADLPDDVERQIDEKTKNLPDEIREKVREKIKEAAEAKLAEMKEKAEEAAEEEEEDSDEDGDEEGDDEDEDEEEEEKEKSAEDLASEEAKKLKSEEELFEARFKHQIALYKQELEAQRLAIEKTKIDLDLEAKRISARNTTIERERDRLKLETEVMKLEHEFEMQKLTNQLATLEAEKKRIETELAVEAVKEKLEDRVIGAEEYPDKPFEDGVLKVSVRRIELNGPIMSGAADYVCQRLDYFNNQSDKPIFLVIDNCPGGSAIEGMQIVQKMKESKAPVHVVVKRFAASMAAIITTLADESYCYPDAIILHHQASATLGGNGREMEDQRKMFDEISRRLIGAVADKIGTTQEEFVEDMYKARISGDWDIFGDEAVKRGWVKHQVKLVREDGVRKRPTGARRTGFIFFGAKTDQQPEATGYLERYEAPLVEQVDSDGKAYVRVPQGGPFDAWLLYNPNGYYRF